ncbi:predicted protein [Sclerotinia sclerotiorum 1980 UF-70]|uniref:Uncharacterized protein n=1 Tax=Sclerotinia sclerotiorum (strain ATCC 18683 / 1980 / Ss-1) TaxID=665079 RepID=A7F9G2_SCLS1|nr:predicted protein [Sclerotinia sclerotiorum 1980 UF-70]EDO00373.1 predicted protein [Sclerotinia sclerotiorum 1980 UF-70]
MSRRMLPPGPLDAKGVYNLEEADGAACDKTAVTITYMCRKRVVAGSGGYSDRSICLIAQKPRLQAWLIFHLIYIL